MNSQGETKEELIENLHSALEEILEMNRKEALAASPQAQPREHSSCSPGNADFPPDDVPQLPDISV